MTFRVMVDDNFHYMDEGERYTLGSFPTAEEAIESAHRIAQPRRAEKCHGRRRCRPDCRAQGLAALDDAGVGRHSPALPAWAYQ